VTYFEIDDAATLRLKETCYQQQHIDANVQFIPGNYVTDGLMNLLEDNDFDPDRPTYLIWEGNTMYLPLESTRRILSELRKYLKRFKLSFDYMAEAVLSKTTDDPRMTRLVESFASMGAPWLSGIRDVQSLAADLGLRLIENVKTAELYERYWLGRPMTSPIFS
jgi:O-methyltransferase involved in polyketide biosynthesis